MMLIKIELDNSAQRAAFQDAISQARIKCDFMDDRDSETIVQALSEFKESLTNKLYHANLKPDSLITEYLQKRIRVTATLIQKLS